MSGAWQLFRADLRNATRNVMAVIVLCGLVVIPSIFTWFNVIASWEPFDNTKNLKVAVASVDVGYTSPLIPIHINVGNTVESTLRANDQLDWVITTKEDAIAGTTSGDYYAAMVLPEDFSERMLTFYASGSPQTEIEYYTNDKSNPLAPLITSEGADDLSAQINAQFVQELDNIALSLISSLANSLDSPESVTAFSGLEAQVGSVSQQLRDASATANMFTALLESSVPLAGSAQRLVDAVDGQLNAANGTVQQGIGAAGRVQQALATATTALGNAFTESDARLGELQAEVSTLFGTIDTQSGTATTGVNALKSEVQGLVTQHTELRDQLATLAADPNLPPQEQAALQQLVDSLTTVIAREQAVVTQLDRALSDIAAGTAKANALESTITGDINAARGALAGAQTSYTNEVKPLLDQLAATLVSVAANFNALTGSLSFVGNITDGAASLLENAAAETKKLSAALTTSAEAFATVHTGLEKAIDSGDLQELITVIGSDPSTLATALSQPIGLDRIPVYPVVSFGAGMAPLYTVLSLWVGALLLAVTLQVEPPKRAYEGGEDLSLNQQFLGRYGIFALMGFAQSTLVFGGNILLVGLDPVHPWLFMLSGWLTSLVFTFLVYTLVVSMSDAGKALAVVILVVQVAGAGGAYPLPLLPQWFQNVSPFLPATHSIDAIRAAMAGIYQGDYWVSIGWLLCFLIPAALLGFVLRKPMIGLNAKMEGMLKSTKLM